MARGDFRGSIGTLIQSPSVRVHNTNGGVVNFQNGHDGRQQEYQAVIESLNAIKGAAQTKFAMDTRAEKQATAEAEYEAKREAERIQRQIDHREGWQGDISYKRYLREMQTFMSEIPEEHAGLSVADFNEQYKDKLPALDVSFIKNPETSQRLVAEAEYATELFHAGRLQAYHQGKTLESYAALSDDYASLGDFNVTELVEEGRSAELSEPEMWMAFTSTARSQLSMGNTQAVNKFYEYAADNIANPELRTEVLRELEPLHARANQTERARKTMGEVVALDKATSFEELDAVFDNSSYSYSDEERVRHYQRVEQDNIKTNLRELATGILEGTNDLSQMTYALTQKQQVEGAFGNYTIGYSEAEAAQIVDEEFRDTLMNDPEKAGELIRNSASVPRFAQRVVNDLFTRTVNTGDMELSANDYRLFAMMDEAVGNDRTGFINKFRLDGIAKEVYTVYHFEKEKQGRSNEESFQYAINVVRQAHENGALSTPAQVETELDSLAESESYLLTPRQMQRAREAGRVYGLTMSPAMAAQAALEDAKSLGAQIGDYNVDNGQELQTMLNVMAQDYQDVTPERMLGNILDSVEGEPFMFFDPSSRSLEVFDVENGRRHFFREHDIRSIISENFKESTIEAVIKRRQEHEARGHGFVPAPQQLPTTDHGFKAPPIYGNN